MIMIQAYVTVSVLIPMQVSQGGGEEDRPQQFLVRATLFSFYRPSHIEIPVLPTDINAYLQNIVSGAYSFFHKLKKKYWKDEDSARWLGRKNEENVARTRCCCGWPSSPPLSACVRKSILLYLYFHSVKLIHLLIQSI